MNRILIVDDYEDLTHVMRFYLNEEGYDVDECSHSDQVFNKIYSFIPDLIILDVFMDEETGRSLCQKIKSMDSTKHIPVILFSSKNFPVDYLAGAGNDDYIQKPFELDELKEKISFHLGNVTSSIN